MSASPEVSVVVAAHNRARRLTALLQSLRRQSIPSERFEVIVVDDASTDETPFVLAGEVRDGALQLHVVRRERSEGPAAARNDGWRAASSQLVAFIDDDCVAAPDWLEQGLSAAASQPTSILQGRVDPIPSEHSKRSPFTRTLRIDRAGPYYQTCNIFYPQVLLKRLDGFDTFFTMPGGEDTDLAWRAIARGTPVAFAGKARAFHAVNRLGVRGQLRLAWHWHESMVVYKRHPALRATVFYKRIFWKRTHYALVRALIAVILPQRLRWARPQLIKPYLRTISIRSRKDHASLIEALFYPVEDAVELAAMVRASIEHRMLVL